MGAASSAAFAAFGAGCAHFAAAGASSRRRFHVCLSAEAIARDPGLIPAIRAAGVDTVWLAGFFYGHWPYPLDRLAAARTALERAGIGVHIVNVPLGHPGDSLGAKDGDFPLTPPRHWRLAKRVEGSDFAGTSLHPPATQENVDALRRLHAAGFQQFFVDDDFRLARGPGEIGGCFCADHQERFLRSGGYSPARWPELIEDVRQRRWTPGLRAWIDFTCDELTASFRAQAAAVDRGRLGIMVMYLGAEKAGIRLADYPGVPFRVGEGMFDDASFGSVKGKTDELFSALMHRRFVRPELAYSETTAFPCDALSAANLAAKLPIATVADVRHTMFMSGVTPFPRSHWETLAPAMKAQAAIHARLAGHVPRGPFKHYWGERSRWVGDDRPFSLFLAAGVPFEVTGTPAKDGWTFVSDSDAEDSVLAAAIANGTGLIARPSATRRPGRIEPIEETLPALFALKDRLRPQWSDVPHVVENEPVVCAWYPTARAVLLWNLLPDAKTLTLAHRGHGRRLTLAPLGTELIVDVR